MRLNRREFIAMNNPLRRWIQKYIEFKMFDSFLAKHNINLHNAVILDAGCGSGYSTCLITAKYRPLELEAFDLMPEQVELAKKRCKTARIFTADVTDTHLTSAKFDAVFVCGILHHEPEWRKALRELYRVLKTGGVLLIEEVSKRGAYLANRYLGFGHPHEAAFDWMELAHELRQVGFAIIEDRKIIFDTFRSYLCMKN
jgi:ubiquinone/menaquinone biosynthesis C-methylase UbiE